MLKLVPNAASRTHTHDVLSVLTHPLLRLAKVWQSDGSLVPYDNPKFYTLSEKRVEGIVELSHLLSGLEVDRHSCLIRGRYVGDGEAQRLDPEYKEGKVRRALAQFEEQPLHALMIDVDKFKPTLCDPLTEPEHAVEEYIGKCLPMEFHGRSCHWQLSSSMGRSGGDGVLKAHIWFWLEDAVDGVVLTDWAVAGDGVRAWPVDVAVFRTVQPLYTAAPVFGAGVPDPVPRRSGFVEGLVGDHVPLVVDAADVKRRADAMRHSVGGAVAGAGAAPRHVVVRELLERDPVAAALVDKGLVLGQAADGALNVVCPFAEGHSGDSGPTATQYFPAHTRGYEKGNFKCMHQSCEGRGRAVWLARLGLGEDGHGHPADESAFRVADESGGFSGGSGGAGAARDGAGNGAGNGAGRERGKKYRGIPEAKHLCTDQANANRIVDAFGDELFIAGGRWFSWDSRCWVPVDTDSETYRSAFNLSRLVQREAAQWRGAPAPNDLVRGKNEDIAKALDKWAARCEMGGHLSVAVKLVQKGLEVAPSKLDTDPWLLNVRNGTVDLRTGVLRPHCREDYITRLVDVDYVAGARSDLWERTLDRIMLEEGSEYGVGAGPLVSFMRRWFGYCCTGLTREQVFVVHWGSGGNGKSTLIDTIADLLSDYAGTAAPGLLAGDKGANERHPSEIAALCGKRMITAHENNEGAIIRDGFIKQATGSDKLKARFMYKDFFEFDPTHKIQLLTNHKPNIKTQDDGIWRRVMLLPYVARFGSADDVSKGQAHYERDMRVAENLKGEAEGILSWLVRGAVEWASIGLKAPDAVLAASRSYQREQDRIGQFIDECCELGVGDAFSAPLVDPMGQGLYPTYQEWCREAGALPLGKIRFLDELERAGRGGITVKPVKVSDGVKRRGIRKVSGIRLLSPC